MKKNFSLFFIFTTFIFLTFLLNLQEGYSGPPSDNAVYVGSQVCGKRVSDRLQVNDWHIDNEKRMRF